jgi:hypothetical protein
MKRPIRIAEMTQERGGPRYPHVEVKESSQEIVPERRIPARTRKPTQRFTLNLHGAGSLEGTAWLKLVE